MNIPEDIRQAILICCSWAELYGHKVEEDAAYAVMEWLDAQPEAPQTMPEEERVTIPEDVRGWIESAAQVASDSARYYDADSSSSDAVLAWLEAQPAASARRPAPVPSHGGDKMTYLHRNGETNLPTEPGWYWFVGSAVMRNVGDAGDVIVRFDEPTAMKVLPYKRGLWFRWGMGHESVTATDGIWSRIPDAPPIDETGSSRDG